MSVFFRARLPLFLGEVYRRRMLAGVEHHLQPLGVEPNDEVLAVGDDRYADSAGQGAPLPQLKDVLRDVRFLELTTVLPEPILDQVAVRSSRRSVDFDVGHGGSSIRMSVTNVIVYLE